MPPAKSYLNNKRLSDPYSRDGKQYIKIELKSGREKEVRFYTDQEFEKLYPGVEFEKTKLNEKHIFGFDHGPITLFCGDFQEEAANRWLCENRDCWRNGIFGWFAPAGASLPPTMPTSLSTTLISWEEVGKEDGTLISRDFARKVANGKRGKELKYCFDPSDWADL